MLSQQRLKLDMKQILNFLWARLLEPSSWIAVVAFAGTVGQELSAHVALPVAIFAGIMAVLLPDTKVKTI